MIPPLNTVEIKSAASNLFSSADTGPNTDANPMLKRLFRSGMDFLLHVFNLSWYLHSFPSIWKYLSLFPSIKWESLSTLLLPSGLSLSPPASQSFLNDLSRLLFFLEYNFILSPRQAGFRPGPSTLDQILFLSQSISDGFSKPMPESRTILATIDFSKAFGSVWHSALFHKLISASLNLFFLIDALTWFFKITKVALFESVEVFCKDPFLAVYFSLSSSMISLLLCLLPSAVFCLLTVWPFVPTPLSSFVVEATQGALIRLNL